MYKLFGKCLKCSIRAVNHLEFPKNQQTKGILKPYGKPQFSDHRGFATGIPAMSKAAPNDLLSDFQYWATIPCRLSKGQAND